MQDFARLEHKVDRLAAAVEKLIIVEERQTTQGDRIKSLETKVEELARANLDLERRLEKWINRGIGMWMLASAALAVAAKVL